VGGRLHAHRSDKGCDRALLLGRLAFLHPLRLS
jgi:hypothetical protein